MYFQNHFFYQSKFLSVCSEIRQIREDVFSKRSTDNVMQSTLFNKIFCTADFQTFEKLLV